MLEILQYIFSSFWIFCGTVILLAIIGEIIVGIFEAVFGNRKYTTKLRYNIGNLEEWVNEGEWNFTENTGCA